MAKISVWGYPSSEARAKKINGVELGTAYNEADFKALVDGAGLGTHMTYIDEDGLSHHYESAILHLGGRPHFVSPRKQYDWETGEEY